MTGCQEGRYGLDEEVCSSREVDVRVVQDVCVNKSDLSGAVKLQGASIEKVEDFKLLGSTVQSKGEASSPLFQTLGWTWTSL